MKRIFVLMFVLIASNLMAHPMGNFSINHYSQLSFNASEVSLNYIIDMAEIPTFQEMPQLDKDGNKLISESEAANFAARKAEAFKRNLLFTVNGKAVAFQVRGSTLTIVPGAGGLPTLVIRVQYIREWKPDAPKSISYRDQNFPDRIGWKEIVIGKSENFGITSANGSFVDRSKQLTQYPEDPAIGPPQETEAKFQLEPKAAGEAGVSSAWNSPSIRALSQRDDSFTRLITSKELTGRIIFVSLLIAFALGAMHALSPGHGKAIVAGYLVGSRGTAYHAVFLGAVVTLTHTIGVFALGLITLYGSRFVLPEKLYPWLSFISGISIVIIGASLFRKRLHALHGKHHHHHGPLHSEHGPEHQHDHDHNHEHGHEHQHLPVDEQGAITWKSLLTVGISGGALPCPSALVVLLSAISLNRVGFGLLLIVAFSLGLAMVLTSIGLLLVYASTVTKRLPKSNFILQRMPLASSLIIAVLGLAIALRAFYTL